MKRELMIPPAAEEDPQAFEIVRVWGAKGQQHVTIFWDLWDDPATWGIMLADLAAHVANAYQQEHGLDRTATLRKIAEMFDEEIDKQPMWPKAECKTRGPHIADAELEP